MENVNKTLYITLYGKAYVSRVGIILRDKKAEEIWEKEGFPLKGKSKSKWLAYYMGMRSAVFDGWLREKLENHGEAVIIHIGCGMDSRCVRVNAEGNMWYDVDFPDVIAERRRYYAESSEYRMTGTDVRNTEWISSLPKNKDAVIVMEGVSMYLEPQELKGLLSAMGEHFCSISLLIDCYSTLAAKASKYKNPINDVGVTKVYGIDDPESLAENVGLSFVREHEMTPQTMINELPQKERGLFKRLYAGKLARRMYRMYELESL